MCLVELHQVGLAIYEGLAAEMFDQVAHEAKVRSEELLESKACFHMFSISGSRVFSTNSDLERFAHLNERTSHSVKTLAHLCPAGRSCLPLATVAVSH